MKVEKLKGISHKNTINLRSISENETSIDTFYQYVPYSLEDSFTENSSQTVKEMHRQFIELAIYLAKNCINTTFSPNRCGVVII
jgi:predicted sulfurtransferase